KASCSGCGQSGSVSKGTSHSFHSVFGNCHRRRSASVIAFLPSRFCFSKSLLTNFCRSAVVTSFSAAFSTASFLARIGSCLAKIGSSEVLRAMLLRVMCGTVLQWNVHLPDNCPVGSVSHVPCGLRERSSASSERSL